MADTYTRLSSISALEAKNMLGSDKMFSQLSDDAKESFMNAAQNIVAAFRNKNSKEDYQIESTAPTVVYTSARTYGTTAQRPTGLTVNDTGFPYFDTTIGSPIWWTGTGWT